MIPMGQTLVKFSPLAEGRMNQAIQYSDSFWLVLGMWGVQEGLDPSRLVRIRPHKPPPREFGFTFRRAASLGHYYSHNRHGVPGRV